MSYEPTPEDRFAFGLWTVSWDGADSWGAPTRHRLDVAEAVEGLAAIGAAGVTFHDDDLAGFDSPDPVRIRQLARFVDALQATGLTVPMVTTDLSGPAVFADGALAAGDRSVRRLALRKLLRSLDLAAELGAQTFVLRAGREGAEHHPTIDIGAALARYREALDLLAAHAIEQRYALRLAIEPSSYAPHGDLLLPTAGHVLAFIATLDHRELVGVSPGIGAEPAAGAHPVAGAAQALVQGKLFHLDLNGPHGAGPGGDRVFGHGDLAGAFALVDLLENAPAAGGPRYDGSRHFGYRPPRTEDPEGLWKSARANIRNYLVLRERARAFRADPCVAEAMAEAGLDQLAAPTLARGEGPSQLLAEEGTARACDPRSYLGGRGGGSPRLHQLVTEHLLGLR